MQPISVLVLAALASMMAAQSTDARPAVLRVCYETWEPLSYSTANGTNGVIVRFFQAAMERLGRRADFQNMPFERCSNSVETSELDILLLSDNEPRSLQVGPAIAYWELGMITHVERAEELTDPLSAFNGARVGMVRGYEYGPIISDLSQRWQVQNIPTALVGLRMVDARRLDLSLADLPWARLQIKQENLSLKLLQPPLLSIPQHTYVTPNNPHLASALDRIYRDLVEEGLLNQIYRELGGESFHQIHARHLAVERVRPHH